MQGTVVKILCSTPEVKRPSQRVFASSEFWSDRLSNYAPTKVAAATIHLRRALLRFMQKTEAELADHVPPPAPDVDMAKENGEASSSSDDDEEMAAVDASDADLLVNFAERARAQSAEDMITK